MAIHSIRNQLVTATQKVRLFADIIKWMLADLFHNAKRLSFFIIGFSIASVFTRLGIIGLLMLFVRAQTSGEPIIVRGYEFPSDTSLTTLALWGGCVLFLALITGIIAYLAESLSFKLAREAMTRASDKALNVIAAGQSHALPLWSNGGMKQISRKAMMGDSMMLMRSMLVLGGITVPLITFCVAVSVLFWRHAELTLYLIPAVMIYTIPFYMLNQGIAKASRDYEQKRQVRSQSFRKILDFASQTQYPGILRPAWAEFFKSDPSAHEAIDCFRGIILSKRKLAMLQDILYGVILCVLLIVFGSFLATDANAWFDLLVYIIALRFVMTGLNGMASLIIALNRFAPQIKRLKEFITVDIPAESTHDENETAKPLSILAIEPKLDGSMNSASPQVGEIIACIGVIDVDSYKVKNFCEKLLSNSKQSRRLFQDIVYCGDVRSMPQLRICEFITGMSDPDPESKKQAEASLDRMGVLDEIQALPRGMDTILTESVVEKLEPACRYAICLPYALSCSRKYIVLDWRPLSRIQEADRKKILDALSDHVVVLVSINGQGSLASNASLVVVMDETAVRGIGDQNWYNEVSKTAMGKMKLDSVLSYSSDDEDDLDLDDDL